MTKAEELQTLLDITAEQINDLVFEYPELSAIEIFENSTKNAVLFLNQVLKEQSLPLKKIIHYPIGRVDTTKMAFCLQDNETAAVIKGNLDFADDTGLDFIGGDEPELGIDHEEE